MLIFLRKWAAAKPGQPSETRKYKTDRLPVTKRSLEAGVRTPFSAEGEKTGFC